MPDTNHTQPTPNAQTEVELFPPPPNAEDSPIEFTQHQHRILLHAAFATITHFFGPPDRLLVGVDDKRDQAKITYPLPYLLWTGVWMFLCHLGARRQVTHLLRYNAVAAANFARLFGLSTVPHGDTLNEAFVRLDPDQLQAIVTGLIGRLIRNKVLLNYRLLDQYYVILIDGTGIYTFHERHCKHCLTKKTRDGKTLYYHNVLEAKLATHNGFAFSVMSEFIENPEPNPTKQDCELKAFYRLAERLKAAFPRLAICLSIDGLFACGPVFETCHKHGWKYMIVLKDDDLPSVTKEFEALAPLNPGQRLKVSTGNIRQEFRWVNEIDYRDTRGHDHQVSVLECLETTTNDDGSSETKRFRWITNFTIKENRVRELAQHAGRIRWKIENEGFNTQKNGGYELEHAYSKDETAAKVFYYLLQIAHLLFQLIVAGSLLTKCFPKGFGSLKNFAFRLIEAWRNCLLTAKALTMISQLRCQIRFDTS